jgi:hypothetical protein
MMGTSAGERGPLIAWPSTIREKAKGEKGGREKERRKKGHYIDNGSDNGGYRRTDRGNE